MTETIRIQYYPGKSINKQAWDKCISNASNGLIYACSTYLDTMSDNWDALVLNNYEAVMPLPWRKKYGMYYLYQPAFVAQLGLFGNNNTPGLLQDFLNAIPRKFRYWDYTLNQGNVFTLDGYLLKPRVNFTLNLNHSYPELYKNYRDNIKRNIKKAATYGCYIKKDIAVDSVIELASQQPQQGATKEDYQKFSILYNHLKSVNQALTYGVYSSQQQLLASCVFFLSHNRAYYILAGNHPNGRTLGASHAVIDAFIKDHAGKNMLLDFEGSDIRNLAFFYSSFGAAEERYAALHVNKLPWYVKWLKK